VLVESTYETDLMSPSFMAAWIDASPVPTRPRIDVAHASPCLVAAVLLVAISPAEASV
jgi:hypothetical protein